LHPEDDNGGRRDGGRAAVDEGLACRRYEAAVLSSDNKNAFSVTGFR
jgi:hypothetical protein